MSNSKKQPTQKVQRRDVNANGVALEAGPWYNNLNKIMFCLGGTGHTPRRELHLLGGVTMDSLYLFPPDDNTPHKQCTGPCGRALPATAEYFHVGKRYKGGLRPQCKECRSKDRREFYKIPEVREKTLAQNKNYRDMPENQEHQRNWRNSYNIRPEVKEHQSKYGKVYRSQNKERISVRMKAYNSSLERQERIREYRETYYDLPGKREHRSSHAKTYNSSPAIQAHRRDLAKAYYSRPEIHARQLAHGHTRRARKKNASGTHTPEQIKEQYQRQKGKCYYCRQKVKWGNHHVDHVIPLTRGGSNDISNLVIACAHCNLSKNNKLPHEFPDGGRLL